MASKIPPRGVRNSNPGNIDRSGVAWQGEDRTPKARAREARFCVFIVPDYGFRALARLLLTYRSKYGLKTVRANINRWAPPVENNTSAYVNEVAKAMGVAPDAQIDVRKPAVMFAMVKAIARHENGGHFWPDSTVRSGLELAGIK